MAACVFVSLAMAASPLGAYADSDSLQAGKIAGDPIVENDQTGAEAAAERDMQSHLIVNNLKSISIHKANLYSVLPRSGLLTVSEPSDPTSTSADKLEAAPVGPTIPMSVLPNPTTEEFIASICEPAREIGQERGLYASVMVAQAILESGSGSSGLSKPPNNNLFGIKGSYKGQAAYMLTSEDDGTGAKYDIMSNFRRYPSVRESLEDYADLLTRDMADFYAPAWKSNAKTYAEACDYLQGHYATDTSYSGKLQGIIQAYGLEQYDHPLEASERTSSAPANADNGRLALDSSDDALDKFAALETSEPSKLAYTAVSAEGDVDSKLIDVDALSKDSLSAVHDAADVADAADESDESDESSEPEPQSPLERRDVQGGIALTVAGLAAALAKGKIAAAAISAKGFLVHLIH